MFAPKQVNLENLEVFINDFLKEDLKNLERSIDTYNDDIMEYVQLKNTVQTMCAQLSDGFKTQMHIGGNIFMEAQVKQPKTILVDVGKAHFIEFSLDEALKFVEFKIKLLTKECDVLREASIKIRAEIKLALLCIAEQEKLHPPEKD